MVLSCWHLLWNRSTAFGIPLLCIELDLCYGVDRAPRAKQGCPPLPAPQRLFLLPQ